MRAVAMVNGDRPIHRPGLAIARELSLTEGKDQMATGQDPKLAATLGPEADDAFTSCG